MMRTAGYTTIEYRTPCAERLAKSIKRSGFESDMSGDAPVSLQLRRIGLFGHSRDIWRELFL